MKDEIKAWVTYATDNLDSDSIYLPSKYPLSGVLPDFEPDIMVG